MWGVPMASRCHKGFILPATGGEGRGSHVRSFNDSTEQSSNAEHRSNAIICTFL